MFLQGDSESPAHCNVGVRGRALRMHELEMKEWRRKWKLLLLGTDRAYRYKIEMDLFLHLLAKEAIEDPMKKIHRCEFVSPWRLYGLHPIIHVFVSDLFMVLDGVLRRLMVSPLRECENSRHQFLLAAAELIMQLMSFKFRCMRFPCVCIIIIYIYLYTHVGSI